MKYNFNQEGKLISAIVPKYTFKFAAVTEYLLEALSEKYLWFSNPDNLNDVFEVTIKNRKDYSQCRFLKEFS